MSTAYSDIALRDSDGDSSEERERWEVLNCGDWWPYVKHVLSRYASYKEDESRDHCLYIQDKNIPTVMALFPYMLDDSQHNGKLEGPFSRVFEQAMRLESTKIIQSKHAAGNARRSNTEPNPRRSWSPDF